MWIRVGAVETEAGGETLPAAMAVDVAAGGNATAVARQAVTAAAIEIPEDGS